MNHRKTKKNLKIRNKKSKRQTNNKLKLKIDRQSKNNSKKGGGYQYKTNHEVRKQLNLILINNMRINFTQGTYNYDPSKVDKVLKVMLHIDRGDFCNYSKGTPEHCYYDRANVIAQQGETETGDHATISAPHMHFIAIYELFDKLKPGNKVLDIGSGSGYLTACFAQLLDTSKNTISKAIGVDVVSKLVKDSVVNINKNHSHLFNRANLQMVCGNGWEGYQVYQKYDAIHVGATVGDGKVPEALWNQLKPGGILFAPIRLDSNVESETIFIITKPERCLGKSSGCQVTHCNDLLQKLKVSGEDESSNEFCHIKKMMNVRYVLLRKNERLKEVRSTRQT